MANKYAKLPEIEQKKFITFHHSWIGGRIPEFVILPPNRKVKVSYMRDNKIQFDNGSLGIYKRVKDNNKTNERSVVVTLEME